MRPSTLGQTERIEVEVGGRLVTLGAHPDVAAPNHYSDALLEALPERLPSEGVVCDVGTGSGVLAIASALLAPACSVLAIDVAPEAVALAACNARDNGVTVAVERADVRSWRPASRFALMLANPPQVPAPADLVDHSSGGEDGADLAVAIVALAGRALAPGGALLLALADFVSLERVARAAGSARLTEPTPVHSIICRPGAYTLGRRDWIERDGYRFAADALGPVFELVVYEVSRPRDRSSSTEP